MKRKITFEDSDKEIQKKYFNVYKEDEKRRVKHQSSLILPLIFFPSHAKKQHISISLSDQEDEDANPPSVASFSQRLTKFWPPAKFGLHRKLR